MSPYLSTCPELASSPKESRNEMYLELAEQKAEKAQYEYWWYWCYDFRRVKSQLPGMVVWYGWYGWYCSAMKNMRIFRRLQWKTYGNNVIFTIMTSHLGIQSYISSTHLSELAGPGAQWEKADGSIVLSRTTPHGIPEVFQIKIMLNHVVTH